MTDATHPPIGTPGQPWGVAEQAAWRARQHVRRRVADEVLPRIEALRATFDTVQYGLLAPAPDGPYPLLALKTRAWREDAPIALVTGGVHGYETSGVQGALDFAAVHGTGFDGRLNVVVVPCVSPWGYERVQRWNAQALDPNRNFLAGTDVPESAALMQLVAPWRGRVLVHIDLHETTDSDETEFRPALAARDGKPHVPGTIPDGFYLVDDSRNPQPAFQRAVIEAVAPITHIAEADPDGTIIGSPVVAPGVIKYDVAALGLCTAISGARYTTITEVYPDSPRASPAQCNAAQVAAVRAALQYAADHG